MELYRLGSFSGNRVQRVEQIFKPPQHKNWLAERNWHDPNSDPNRIYRVDYRAETDSTNWLIFGIGSPGKCWQTTTSVQHYRLEGMTLKSVFAYNESASSSATAFGALKDNADFSFSMKTERKDFKAFLRETVRAA